MTEGVGVVRIGVSCPMKNCEGTLIDMGNESAMILGGTSYYVTEHRCTHCGLILKYARRP
jgi:hypothetical protein